MNTFKVANFDLPGSKNIIYSLSLIYGIGLSTAKKIVDDLKLNSRKKLEDFDDDSRRKMTDYIRANFVIGNDLKNKVKDNILIKIKKGIYQGNRHAAGLPVRGQRTSTNAQTAKRNSQFKRK